MQININLDFSLRQKRIIRRAVVAGATIAAFGIGVALAGPIDTSWIVSGQPIKSMNLKSDLDGLQSQIADLQTQIAATTTLTNNATKYSVGATKYCGASAATAGSAGGLTGVKTLCEAAPGCSPSAHPCTGDEISRSLQVGITISPNPYWYSGMSYAAVNGVGNLSDCDTWSSSAPAYGPAIQDGKMLVVECNNSQPFACCD